VMAFHNDSPMIDFEASTTPLMVSRANFVAAATLIMVNFEMAEMAAMSAMAEIVVMVCFVDDDAGVLFCSFLFTPFSSICFLHLLLLIPVLRSFFCHKREEWGGETNNGVGMDGV